MTAGRETEPYVGLRPYDLGDAERFFGRSHEIWELTSSVLSSRLVVVYGPSGVGKTSLIRAGVLAELSADSAQVLPVGRLPRASTLPSVTTPGNNPYTLGLLSSWNPDLTDDTIQDLTVARFLEEAPVRLDRYGESPLPLVAVIDQFEEVLRIESGDPRREAFLDDLARAVAVVDRLHLVLVMQQDVLGELLPDERKLSGGNRRRYKVHGLDPASAIEAVTGPLRTTARTFAPGAAEALVDRLSTTTIVNEVGEQRTVVSNTVEPINLQVVCSALWRGLPDEVTIITTEDLEDYADVDDTLLNFCVSAVIDVASGEGIDVQAVWKWLEERFVTDLGTRSFVYEGVTDTGGMPHAVARALEQHRILRAEERSQSVWFELLHDGLIDPIRRGRAMADEQAPAASSGTQPEAYLRLAENALHAGMVPLAVEYAKGAVRASQHDLRTLAEANSFLGKVAFGQGRTETGTRAEQLYASAEDDFRRAAELFDTEQNPTGVGRVLGSLGRLFMEQGRYVDAAGELRNALERLPGDVDIRLDFARALRRDGQLRAAAGEYTAVLQYAPDDAREERVAALVGRGTIGAEYDDPASGLRDLDDAIRLQPELAEDSDVVAARIRAFARMEHRSSPRRR